MIDNALTPDLLIENEKKKTNKKTNKKNDKNTNTKTKKILIIEEDEVAPIQETGLIPILKKLLEKTTLKELSEKLNLASGTITRWIELNDIPTSYEFDLLKISGIKIDYSKYSSKQKDQFFTPVDTAKECYNVFCDKIAEFGESIDDYIFIEPSAGDGNFMKVFPQDRIIAMDIEPKADGITTQDYLEWLPPENSDKKYVVFGNPPFGLRGHMALKFINHSYSFADYVCFILPQLFESDGKGVPRKRVKGFNLIHSEKMNRTFYEPNGNEIKINTIFQIWSKNHSNEEYEITNIVRDDMRIYSMSDGGTVATTRNKKMIGKCDVYIPSTCFGKEKMKCYSNFEDLPGKKGYGVVFNKNKQELMQKAHSINWVNVAFLSTNSAYNLRSSQIYALFD